MYIEIKEGTKASQRFFLPQSVPRRRKAREGSIKKFISYTERHGEGTEVHRDEL